MRCTRAHVRTYHKRRGKPRKTSNLQSRSSPGKLFYHKPNVKLLGSDMDFSSVREYEYSPLWAEDAIRVIVLEPAAQPETPLHCSIIQYSRSRQLGALDRTRDYSAVSYTWGPPIFSHPLCIDQGSSRLMITPIVDSLLRHMRKPDTPRYLWIDAICLNQKDDDEKAQQVPLLGEIYEGAKKVHIWIGDEDEMTAGLFAALRVMAMIPNKTRLPVDMARQTAAAMEKVLGPDYIFHMRIFLSRAWFTRRWIIQEACLARQAKIHCGKHSLGLSWFVSAAQRLQYVQSMVSYELRVTQNLVGERKPILELLWNFHAAGCVQQQDRIAALYGLIPEDETFTLGYNKAPWTSMYKRLAEIMFRRSQETSLQMLLHLFEFGQLSVASDSGFPSWVPDWSKERRRDLPYHTMNGNLDLFDYPSIPGYPEVAVLVQPHTTVHTPPSEFGRRLQPGAKRTQQRVRASYYREEVPHWTENRTTEVFFDHDHLYIRWHDSSGGDRGRSLSRLQALSPISNGTPSSVMALRRVRDTLRDFFPSTHDCRAEMDTMSMLFCHTIKFRKPDWSIDEKFIARTISDVLGSSASTLGSDQIGLVEEIHAILEEFCLFKLEPLECISIWDTAGSLSKLRGDFGLGPRGLGPGDILVPVWRFDEDRSRHGQIMSGKKTRRFMATMLAMRLQADEFATRNVPFGAAGQTAATAPESSWMNRLARGARDTIGGLTGSENIIRYESQNSHRRPVRKGRIIGPAVCIMSDGTQRYAEHDIQLNGQMVDDLGVDQPCLIQLM
ncbi:HET domain-containing protein [Colletotrichum kahawae]|uniref:HET domain-containing protein n=1 Tax=Colletotrichum kahawae TaxID=34407 RepID=A0AAD9YBH4_COLKA|nr:HET domain-containing protein [Colletotrichum kahawae]